MHRSFFRRALPFLVVSAGVMFQSGCYTPGGGGFSTDTHTYPSTSWLPATVSLEDTRTRQNFWSIDVPVGKQLVVHIRRDQGVKGSDTPDLMEWEIMEGGEMFGQLDNSIPVPRDVQLVQTYRPAPVFREGTTAAPVTPTKGE
jgi:hypothetical protein